MLFSDVPLSADQTVKGMRTLAESCLINWNKTSRVRVGVVKSRRANSAAPSQRAIRSFSRALAHGERKMESKRGTLIVFEGLDRSGKSTQCLRLVENLRNEGEKVEHMRFPKRITPIGQMINNYLNGETQQEDHVIHLLFSANRWESAQAIENYISSGTTVVIDRYSYSGCVYSAAKENKSMDLAWCRQPEVGLPRPDLCLFLDISAKDAAKRGGFGTERYEKQDLQDRVRQLYAEMREHEDEREDIVIVDAGKSIEEVEEEILRIVKEAKKQNEERVLALRHIRPW